MRRGRAGDGARPPRRLDSARAAARRLRRLARRQQGEQHRQGGAHVRPRRQGFPQGADDAARAADAVHHPLEFQPFRRARGDRRRSRLHQRSGDGPPPRSTWRSSISPSPASRSPWSRPRHSARSAASRKGLRLLLRELRASRAAVALLVAVSLALIVPGIVIPGFSKVFVDDILIQRNQQLARSAADRHGHDRAVPRGADGAAAVAAAAAADQALGRHDQPLSLARDVAADGLLHPAPRRRYRQPRRHQRADRAACSRAASSPTRST